MNPRLLLIDDDRRLAEMVVRYLGQSGMVVEHRGDAASGLAALETLRPDLVLLDLMLPDADGLDVCRQVRVANGPARTVPILMLTARGEITDRVVGLELGADDYLSKPFEPRELLARVRALLRRAGTAASAFPARPASASGASASGASASGASASGASAPDSAPPASSGVASPVPASPVPGSSADTTTLPASSGGPGSAAATADPGVYSRRQIRLGALEIDLDAREARVRGAVRTLTAYQFDLLAVLAANAGRVMSRERLLDQVKGEQLEAFDRSIDVHVGRIRLAIEDDPKHPRRLLTVRGAGYVMARQPVEGDLPRS